MMHVSRAFSSTRLEDDCPCPKAPCGFAVPEEGSRCGQHSLWAGKTIRRSHSAENCPGGDDA